MGVFSFGKKQNSAKKNGADKRKKIKCYGKSRAKTGEAPLRRMYCDEIRFK